MDAMKRGYGSNEELMESPQFEADESAEYESQEEKMLEIAERLHVFATRLSKLVSEQAAKRHQIEQRWLDDLRQYHGEYGVDELSKLRQTSGSEIFVNITRNKTSAAEARLQDMLFPTDDRNWGIGPTPVPELERMSNQPKQQGIDPMTGQPVEYDPAAIAAEAMAEAKEKSQAMQDEIDDQLSESRYQLKARDIIHDACLLGTGIVKGPVIVGRTKRRWDQMPDGTSILSVEEALEPAVERVDPWDFFPDMSARTIDEAEFVFERRRMSKKQLREMAKLPGVLTEQVRELVREEAKTTHIAKNFTDDIRNITGINTVGEGNKFEVWEYHGPVSKTELLDALSMSEEETMDYDEIDELDDELDAIVFFSGTKVLKVVVNPMETNERPYAVFNWEKDESYSFGFGVPYLMRSPQRVINASWRMMMDNAGLAVADQVVINKELVQPADGNWNMTPKKIWYLRDKTRAVGEAFASFSTPSHQAEMANIFTMARQLADEETNLPLIAQGEQSAHVTKTSSGMAMLMNSANIVLRKAVKNWDDDITRPLITRFYDWNMQFNDNPDIKGDYFVDARGSGALLVREKQQENLMIYSNISIQNPEFAARRDWAGLDREIAKSLELPYENITKTDAEIQQEQEQMQEMQGQDPALMAQQADMQLKQMKLQIEQQKAQFDAQIKSQEAQLRQAELQAKVEIERSKLAQQRELEMAGLAARNNLTERQLQARAAIDGQKIQADRDKAAAKTNVEITKTQLQAQNIAKGFDTY